jgi:NAD(P)-dependent dehydrogenase (short-subunit alcohol dehydrogenase family)
VPIRYSSRPHKKSSSLNGVSVIEGRVVLFLASKNAQFLTGYSLTPDGGQIIDSAR